MEKYLIVFAKADHNGKVYINKNLIIYVNYQSPNRTTILFRDNQSVDIIGNADDVVNILQGN